MSSKKEYKDIDRFFGDPLTPNQKAWGLIHEFYHIVLTYMEEKNISKADLARKLGKSRASISQMFNKTPNLTVKKMVEIADVIGIDLNISTDDLEKYKSKKIIKQTFYVPVMPNSTWQGIRLTSKKSKYKDMEIVVDNSYIELDRKEVMPC